MLLCTVPLISMSIPFPSMDTLNAAMDYIYPAICLFLLVALPLIILSSFFKKDKHRLPPGPPGWPIVGNLLQSQPFQAYVGNLKKKYGPIFTIRVGPHPMIMVGSHELAHEALVQRGANFATRPTPRGPRKFVSSNGLSINAAAYGPTWRALRRNLVTEALSPAAIRSFKQGREWGMEVLMEEVSNEARSNGAVVVVHHLRYAAFCILLYMCFGVRLEDKAVREVEGVLRDLLISGGGVLEDTFPLLGFFFRKRLRRIMALRERQIETVVPLIERRREALAEGKADDCRAYLDSLLSLTVDGGRHLTEIELVTLCTELLNAGTDTTTTTVEWLMANLVKRPHIQAKLYDEIVAVAGKEKPLDVDDLSRMPYLEAVVKETLRRHPPVKVVVPHAVTEACALGGYDIPAGAIVNFCVGEMGNDPRVWENPGDFVPERFLGADVDITGSKEIKMMPFGAGRRICPGWGLAMFHVELIVGRLVQKFKWECKPGETVELEEKHEFTTVMKNPLQAVVKERQTGLALKLRGI